MPWSVPWSFNFDFGQFWIFEILCFKSLLKFAAVFFILRKIFHSPCVLSMSTWAGMMFPSQSKKSKFFLLTPAYRKVTRKRKYWVIIIIAHAFNQKILLCLTVCCNFTIFKRKKESIGSNLAKIVYDQCEMRNHLVDFLHSNKIKPFLRFNRARGEELLIDITNNTEDTSKRISPKKFSK